MKNKAQQVVTACLFIIYLMVLIWIIVFKLQLSIRDIPYYRSLNLIPLQGSANGDFSTEVYSNVLIFIPFGVYIAMLKGKWSFFHKILPIACVSFLFEVSQYIFAIGASDITDLIGNTLGGIIGIVFYAICHGIFKSKTNAILNTIAFVVTIGIPLCFVFPLLYNTYF